MTRMNACRTAMLCLAAIPAVAQDRTPPPEFFIGTYRMIGTGPAGPVDQQLRLERGDDGNLKVLICGLADAGGLALPAPQAEGPYLEGRIGAEPVSCEAFSDYDNYPAILCYGNNGARLTLWPDGDFATPPACGG